MSEFIEQIQSDVLKNVSSFLFLFKFHLNFVLKYSENKRLIELINPRDNPVMYLWLLSCLLQNRMHAKDNKGRTPDVEKTYEEMFYMVDRAVNEFTKAENSDWYN